jgi:hypothetical protein
MSRWSDNDMRAALDTIAEMGLRIRELEGIIAGLDQLKATRPRTVPGEDFSFDIPDPLPPGGRFVVIQGGSHDE